LDRKVTVALLKELGAEHLVQPLMVLVEQRKPDNYQLKIKGDYNTQEIELFLKNRGFSFEENNDYLIIFKP
jgi:hypothetical protein